ncbi:PIN domain-containing protein [Rhizobium binxianense]
MIVLDTNILSEAAKPSPNPRVGAWMSRQAMDRLYLCDIVVMEQSHGAEYFRIRTGSLRYMISFERLLETYRGRLLGFDHHAAIQTGVIRARRDGMGRPIAVQDAMIAAICLENGATLATRNTKDFEGLDLRLVNPFEDG